MLPAGRAGRRTRLNSSRASASSAHPPPAHRRPRVPGGRRDPLAEVRPGALAGGVLGRRVHGGAEDDGRTYPGNRGTPHLLLERGIRNGEQRQFGRPGQLGEGRVAPHAADLVVPRVDE
ncbi:MAG TPA: hypothetical protein VF838_08185 [Trebonia sp.]